MQNDTCYRIYYFRISNYGIYYFVIGNDLEIKDQIRLFIGFSIFIIAITIGAGMLTGWK